VQKSAQHRRRQLKRQIAGDDVRCARQRVFQEVGLDDAGAGRGARREPRGVTGIDLDGRKRPTEFLLRMRQYAVACADFDKGPSVRATACTMASMTP
jgi:hypothetical protein